MNMNNPPKNAFSQILCLWCSCMGSCSCALLHEWISYKFLLLFHFKTSTTPKAIYHHSSIHWFICTQHLRKHTSNALNLWKKTSGTPCGCIIFYIVSILFSWCASPWQMKLWRVISLVWKREKRKKNQKPKSLHTLINYLNWNYSLHSQPQCHLAAANWWGPIINQLVPVA